jgi:hypothetical protein
MKKIIVYLSIMFLCQATSIGQTVLDPHLSFGIPLRLATENRILFAQNKDNQNQEIEDKSPSTPDSKDENNETGNNPKDKKSSKPLNIWLLIFIIGVIAVCLLGVKYIGIPFYRRRQFIDCYLYDLDRRMQNIETNIDKAYNHRLCMIEGSIENLRKKIIEIENRINILGVNNKPVSDSQPNGGQLTVSNIKYLKNKTGNIFHQVSDIPDGCFFKLFDINDHAGKFEFCGNIMETIANRNAVLDSVCETSGIPQNAKEIQNLSPGEVEFRDSKWVVTKQARIKFI